MSIRIALAGNPNCGKTTMFNALTGANQYVGNWPGVTVEKKEGKLKGEKDVVITDLPGIYSLSPYTNEEVVSRDYLASDEPAAVLNIVDATNIERNLYLTTQIMELGKPVVIALNMMDVLERTGDKIDVASLSEKLGCKIIETSALKGKGIKEAALAAVAESSKTVEAPKACFASDVEASITEMTALVPSSVPSQLKRWYAIKLLERDQNVIEKLNISSDMKDKVEAIAEKLEKAKDDDTESIITNERYNFIMSLLKGSLKKGSSKLTTSDKIDRVVTNRILGIPIFLLVMWFVYWVAVSTVGGMGTDWANDTVVGGFQGIVEEAMTNAGANEILTDCVVNGVIGGLGAVFGFLPQMAILFLLLSILEDVGYMVRIAFVMDRLFRKFGLSGKSFIPLLISSGCGIPGIMASRTIENENDRRMTIMTTTWIPCGAKLPVIALFGVVIASKLTGNDGSWVGPLMYVVGVASVLIAAIILKKTKYFHGPAAPFVMELPQYHIPAAKTILMHTWERLWSFIKKAGTILFLACIVMWFLSSYGFGSAKDEVLADDGSVVEEAREAGFGLVDPDESLLANVGNCVRYIFVPLGFGNKDGGWQAAASSISGFSAKEAIVSTMGVLANVDSDTADAALEEEEAQNEVSNAISSWFPSALAAFAFLLFNLLDSPCLAAIATMASELKSRKWFWFAIAFQNIFAWLVTFSVYQIGSVIAGHGNSYGANTFGFILALVFVVAVLFGIFRKNPYKN
ncbi:MAG: ferrous iron transport protein B [Treponema sp.]|nr:ferrous iron transport protein B [Treponema sp.]